MSLTNPKHLHWAVRNTLVLKIQVSGGTHLADFAFIVWVSELSYCIHCQLYVMCWQNKRWRALMVLLWSTDPWHASSNLEWRWKQKTEDHPWVHAGCEVNGVHLGEQTHWKADCCHLFLDNISHIPSWPCYIIEDDLDLLIILLLSPQCWDYRHVTSCLAYTELRTESMSPCTRQALYQLSSIPTLLSIFCIHWFAFH